ncbi:MAG: methyltransferase [Planctomycetes bacterium]|nr:methyltransferase [Planctomycetota bacterium]
MDPLSTLSFPTGAPQMSVDQGLVTAAHFRYIAEHCQGEDAFLQQLRHDAQAAEIPAISIGPLQATFVQILLRAARAKQVIEVGTLAGYSAISMARALPDDGCVRTIEIEPAHAAFAEAKVADSDVAGKVVVHCGSGQDILPTFESGSADAAFLDADKSGYATYLEECCRILKPGGLVMVDNAFAFGQLFYEDPTDREVPAVRAFNDHMAQHPGVDGIIVPFGDGMWVGATR